MPITATELAAESLRATELLAGKVVSHVSRHCGAEVSVEFVDGSHLLVERHSEELKLSITSGTAAATQLTVEQAYRAMFAFLEGQFNSTGSSDIGALLGSLALLPDGSPADPAHRQEWATAIEVAVRGTVNAGLSLDS